MAIAFVQTNPGDGGNPMTVSLGTLPIAGNLLVLALGVNSGVLDSVTSVVDNAGNTWTRATSAWASGYSSTELWYASNVIPAAVTHTITVTAPGASAMKAVVQEFSGITITSPLDKVATNATDDGTTFNAGPTAVLSQAAELVVMCSSQVAAATLSAGAGYSNFDQATGVCTVAAESKVVSSTTGVSGTITTSISGKGTGLIATFKGSGSSASASVSPSASLSPSPSPSVSPSASLSPSISPSISPSSSVSPSVSLSPSQSPSSSPSASLSPSLSPSVSPSVSVSPSPSPVDSFIGVRRAKISLSGTRPLLLRKKRL